MGSGLGSAPKGARPLVQRDADRLPALRSLDPIPLPSLVQDQREGGERGRHKLSSSGCGSSAVQGGAGMSASPPMSYEPSIWVLHRGRSDGEVARLRSGAEGGLRPGLLPQSGSVEDEGPGGGQEWPPQQYHGNPVTDLPVRHEGREGNPSQGAGHARQLKVMRCCAPIVFPALIQQITFKTGVAQ